MPRILLFLAWPLIEIGLFVVIGGEIGLWPTLAWVVLTALAGIVILRLEASRGAMLIRNGLTGAALQQGAPVNGLMRALAAVLLILPGFLTDALGLVLLLPPVQALVARYAASRVTVIRPQGAGDVIDGDYTEVGPRSEQPSGWTRIE